MVGIDSIKIVASLDDIAKCIVFIADGAIGLIFATIYIAQMEGFALADFSVQHVIDIRNLTIFFTCRCLVIRE